jgi:short-subunit dehydrogenase
MAFEPSRAGSDVEAGPLAKSRGAIVNIASQLGVVSRPNARE